MTLVHSDLRAASVAANIELERARAHMRLAEDEALAGNINGDALIAARGKLERARRRADRAHAEADAERALAVGAA